MIRILTLLVVAAAGCFARQTPAPTAPADTYVLGPGDEVKIWALGMEDFGDKPYRIDPSGFIDLPMLGHIKASGLTTEEFKRDLETRVKTYVRAPEVSVAVTGYRSQPVSVVGEVNAAGVHALDGRKTLVEMLAMAGGLRPDAGHTIVVTRSMDSGPIPLPEAKVDPSGKFSVAELSLDAIMQGRSPAENIAIMPHDVISVPRAQMVYVVGQVKKAGGFVLHERERISILQALSLAEGTDRAAAPGSAKVIRRTPGNQRQEIPVDIGRILAGKSEDILMQPEDILFIPASAAKSAGLRGVQAAIEMATGVVIWRR